MDKIIQVFNVKMLDQIDMSEDVTSDILEIQRVAAMSIQEVWTGFSGNALISFQGSNDGVNFTTIDACSVIGAAGSRLINIEKAAYGYVRVIYDQDTATGTLTVSINGKAI